MSKYQDRVKTPLTNSQSGFTLIELMIVIVIIGILIAVGLPNFIGAQERSKLASVKTNMHTIHNMVELYAVDWGGIYPDTYDMLGQDAIAKNYTKEFNNPISGLKLTFQNNVNCQRSVEFILSGSNPTSYTTTSAYAGPGGVACAGQVVYTKDPGTTAKYGIYGLDGKGLYIVDRGKILEMTNS